MGDSEVICSAGCYSPGNTWMQPSAKPTVTCSPSGKRLHHVGVGFQTGEQLPADLDIVFDHVAQVDRPANDAL